MFVEVLPGGNSGLVHVSEMDLGRVDDPADLFELGDLVDVMCLEILPGGKQKLSRCASANSAAVQRACRWLDWREQWVEGAFDPFYPIPVIQSLLSKPFDSIYSTSTNANPIMAS